MSHRRLLTHLLKGEDPSGIPVERGLKSIFRLNLQAAGSLGVEVPPEIIDEADILVE